MSLTKRTHSDICIVANRNFRTQVGRKPEPQRRRRLSRIENYQTNPFARRAVQSSEFKVQSTKRTHHGNPSNEARSGLSETIRSQKLTTILQTNHALGGCGGEGSREVFLSCRNFT